LKFGDRNITTDICSLTDSDRYRARLETPITLSMV